ncbi:hypothetical protein PPYR_14353 [Photinus pyralis]|uniref:Uncharacterized protein n=1 Tax=Photinus pyralis TaxID=7054 RepID=A0A1Y1N6Z8_PHOPY|nr:uncharacterized protein LOC116180954 [Photinus pyralis]KAB0792394.1 hypothetical protein PPYR_14353 [Photinus pyralis]
MYAAVRFLTILCAVHQVFSNEERNYWGDPISVECIEEVHFDKTILPTVMDKDFYIVSTDPSVFELFRCMFEKLKMVQDGKFVKDEIVRYVEKGPVRFLKPNADNPNKIALEAYEGCKSLEGDGIGQQAVNMRNCIIREIYKYK